MVAVWEAIAAEFRLVRLLLKSYQTCTSQHLQSSKIGNVIIEENLISLTLEQAVKSVELCQSLSDLHQDIVLFRFDELKGEIYILAGQAIEMVIYASGNWEFILNETEL